MGWFTDVLTSDLSPSNENVAAAARVDDGKVLRVRNQDGRG